MEPFHQHLLKIKNLGINLRKYVQDQYEEDYKFLLRETKTLLYHLQKLTQMNHILNGKIQNYNNFGKILCDLGFEEKILVTTPKAQSMK